MLLLIQTKHPVGVNGFADSLETATDNGIAKDAFIASNYTTYALDSLPMVVVALSSPKFIEMEEIRR